jgi:hypothetical protein
VAEGGPWQILAGSAKMPLSITKAGVKSMKPLRVPLRAVLYKEGKHWIAQCLEFDLCGDGDTREQAMSQLCQCILVQVQASIKHKNLAALFSPAEGRFFEMFALGTHFESESCAALTLKIDLAPVAIEKFEAREYAEPDLVGEDANLVPA